jgi:uncharacterized membrane protein HdeD (DUF308 family)
MFALSNHSSHKIASISAAGAIAVLVVAGVYLIGAPTIAVALAAFLVGRTVSHQGALSAPAATSYARAARSRMRSVSSMTSAMRDFAGGNFHVEDWRNGESC